MSKQFVLVHGMSHGGWAWEAVSARLEAAGHRALAPDLPGHGRRAHERARASVDGYARAVADAMMRDGFTAAVIVGHSMGGVVLQRLAELVPQRIAHLCFLAAVVVPPGGSLLTTHVAPAGRALFEGLARSGGGVVRYPAATAYARWLGDLAAGDARVVDALGRLTSQPLRPWTERVDLRQFYRLRLPSSYVRCLHDAAVPPAKAEEYARRLGVAPIDMDSAHEPMLSMPDELVKVLETL